MGSKPTIQEIGNNPNDSGSVLDHHTADMNHRVKRDLDVTPGKVYLMERRHFFSADEHYLVKIEQSYQKDRTFGTQTHVIVTDLMTGERRDVDLSDVDTFEVHHTDDPTRVATLRIQMGLAKDDDTRYDFEQK